MPGKVLVPWQMWQTSCMCRMLLITLQQGIPGVHFQKTEMNAAEQLICNPTGSLLCTYARCSVHTHGIDSADGMPHSSSLNLHVSSHIVYRLNKHASVFISALKAASYSLCAYGWIIICYALAEWIDIYVVFRLLLFQTGVMNVIIHMTSKMWKHPINLFSQNELYSQRVQNWILPSPHKVFTQIYFYQLYVRMAEMFSALTMFFNEENLMKTIKTILDLRTLWADKSRKPSNWIKYCSRGC